MKTETIKPHTKHYGSYFTNEQECLKAILQIHNQGQDIECDPMYFKGNFYKDGLNKPKYKFDISPQVDDCQQGDATNLPIDANSLNSIILDPPFLFGVHGKTKNYYSAKNPHNIQRLARIGKLLQGYFVKCL